MLTDEEILCLEESGCKAEDWTSVNVAEDFVASNISDVQFFGEVFLGVFEKNVEVAKGFVRHSGIHRAILRNVSIGDNSLVENISNYISNYSIGEECYICNVCLMETTEEATFGEGNTISTLNEAGAGNVILFSGLTSNLAALMIDHSQDKETMAALRRMIREDISLRAQERGYIGNRVKIINTTEITNTHISDSSEVSGARRLSDCTITSSPEDAVYIGSGVICENSIIADGSAILDGAKLYNCYVAEATKITNSFTAENSLFFANSFMACGEASASFCGPFSISHHKSSLLIGGKFSFYNAGSGTNFSNHAYKMGPVHYGILERGTKTASSAHILFPAKIGAFSVCMGKIMTNPDTTIFPFSYVIADGRRTILVPGKNLTSSGLYRDITKWPRRDVRLLPSRKSLINFSFLSPFTIGEILKGKQALESLKASQTDETKEFYTYKGCEISRASLYRGIILYSMAIDMFIGETLALGIAQETSGTTGTGEWRDLSGLLIPSEVEKNIISGINSGFTSTIAQLKDKLKESSEKYRDFLRTFLLDLIRSLYGLDRLTQEDIDELISKGETAKKQWINQIKLDAEKEYDLGDVDRSVLDDFLFQLGEGD